MLVFIAGNNSLFTKWVSANDVHRVDWGKMDPRKNFHHSVVQQVNWQEKNLAHRKSVTSERKTTPKHKTNAGHLGTAKHRYSIKKCFGDIGVIRIPCRGNMDVTINVSQMCQSPLSNCHKLNVDKGI